jgi:hypothetical protein
MKVGGGEFTKITIVGFWFVIQRRLVEGYQHLCEYDAFLFRVNIFRCNSRFSYIAWYKESIVRSRNQEEKRQKKGKRRREAYHRTFRK